MTGVLTMNALSSSDQRPAVAPASAAVRAPAVTLIARDAPAAANEDAVAVISDQETNSLWMNPLWVITAVLALFMGLAAMVLAAS
jgi:hypothetical protein